MNSRKRRKKEQRRVSLAGPNGTRLLHDLGLKTSASRARTVVESMLYVTDEGEVVNPNAVKRARRIPMIEVYWRHGRITRRQFEAAMVLLCAWERTMQSPAAIKPVQVDATPKPDHAVAMMIDRIGGYHAVAKFVPRWSWEVVDQVILHDGPITEMSGYNRHNKRKFWRRLEGGLDMLATRLKM